MSFCTAITCLDGRTHLPVIEYLQKRFDVEYVDLISEAGPNRILALNEDTSTVASILKRVAVSLEKHGAVAVAVVGHHDCAGNPSLVNGQTKHTEAAVRRIQAAFPEVDVVGLWVNDNWIVSEMEHLKEE